MGIKKEIENEYKAKFNYHKISEVRIFTVNGVSQLRITTESYVDKEARKAGAKAVKTENIIENADFALTPFYALLKAKFPMFQDGEDDFNDEWKTIEESRPQYTQQTPSGELLAQWEEAEIIEDESEVE